MSKRWMRRKIVQSMLAMTVIFALLAALGLLFSTTSEEALTMFLIAAISIFGTIGLIVLSARMPHA